MSLSDSFPDSNGRGSGNFMMRVKNQIVEGDQGKQRTLQPLFGNIHKGQNYISRETEDKGGYYLPRSSPVISRRKEMRIKKPSIASHNRVSHEHSDENFQKGQEYSASKMLQNFLQEEQTIPTASVHKVSQGLLLDTDCAPAAVQNENSSGKQRKISCGSSESQSSSCEESDLLNSAASQLRKGTISYSDPGTKELVSGDFYRNSVDLDLENAHFVVVDMVLEVLEAAKWTLSQKHSDSFSSTDSGYEELCDQRLSSNRSSKTSVHRCSAEILAQNLLMDLGRWWWISSEELLGEFPVVTVSMASGSEASLSDEIRQKSRMRGTLIWSPPEFQIIHSVNTTQRRSDVVASQQFLCAGCGTEIEPRYMKRLRYCDYLGKYFCDGCHGGGEAIIPARVLNHWDFGRYPVCQFSKQLLESIWEKPLFKVTNVAKNLYSQAKELQKFREIQEQLISIKKLLRTCRLSEGVLAEFQELPSHLTEALHLFAMDDLIKIRRGQLLPTGKAVMRSATNHVEACLLCQARGFICEFCRGKDVLFPFQTDICTRCQECRACFHTSCFLDEECPKCTRIENRRAARR
ncbi:protein associated with UVRAG as autophagy enhancer [Clarias gariepinus]|uniref:protein associated with UVRAG as autophagy enhancer n=1 Tax=Clarias gariepinus TaxID=13013 RepID=UPI00234C0FE3|nr:protein associated with UVRAG as autophagy enhancer [Clarias gariepinus]